MKHSIRKQMAVFFIGLMVFILLTNWLINNFFLEEYYILKKKKVLIDAYQQINQVKDVEDYGSIDFRDKINEIGEANNVTVIILNREFRPVFDPSFDWELAGRVWGFYYDEDNSTTKILEKTMNYVIQKNERWDSDFLQIWGLLDTRYYFMISMPFESIRENVRISNEFLSYFSILGIGLSVILILWMSKRITEPLLELTELSKKMADLDFETKYTNVAQNEIGQLGEHFNQMSRKLETTISELKTANNELQRDIEQKMQIDEMRKEFLANVSHELKTPIALIQGYAEGLSEGIDDDEESRAFYCEVIIDESAKMNKIVKKLLTLNQLEFGNETINVERFDITSLISEIVQSSEILAQQKGAKIIFREAQSVFAWGDEFKIEEVVINYISNALNHVTNEMIIDIKVIEKNGKIRVSVFNTGLQIPEDELEKVWIKFYKVDRARTRKYGGSGIGLSIVKAIMDSFNQKYGVTNYDNGVEFWFELEAVEKGSPEK